MVQENLQQNRPSRDEKFANRVHLFNAVEAGQTEQVKALLDKDTALVNAQNGGEQTPLHRAAYRGHKAIVELPINKESDVNAKDRNGQTPLHKLAYISVMTEIAELMINSGVDINAKDNDGNMPLFLALSQQHQQLRGNWKGQDFTGILVKRGGNWTFLRRRFLALNISKNCGIQNGVASYFFVFYLLAVSPFN